MTNWSHGASSILLRRPCYVKGERALFHRWIDSVYPKKDGGVISQCLGIVEYDTGKVEQVKPDSIIFADGGGFKDYVWLPVEEWEKKYGEK